MESEMSEEAKAVQEIAKTTGKGLDSLNKLGGFLSDVFKEPIEHSVGMFADKLKFMRWERQLRLIDRVEEINRRRNIAGKTQAVPPKLAIPIIEQASFEENDELQDLWANLLSSAQDSTMNGIVRTSFIDMLKQMEAIDVRLLNSLYKSYLEHKKQNTTITPNDVSFSKNNIINALHISINQYENIVDNLMRLRCVKSRVVHLQNIGIGGFPPTIDRGYEEITLTSLGVDFSQTCIRE